MNYFTPADDEFIRVSRLDGKHATEIARHLGRSLDSVKARMCRLKSGNVSEAAARAEARERELLAQREQVVKMALAGNHTSMIRSELGIGWDIAARHVAILRYEGRLPPAPRASRPRTDGARLAVRAPANVHSARVSLGNGANVVARSTLEGVSPYEPLTNVGPSRTCMRLLPGHDVYPDLKYCDEPSVENKSFCAVCASVFYVTARRAPASVYVP